MIPNEHMANDPFYVNNGFYNYVNMLMNHPERIRIRFTLLVLIDYSIVYNNLLINGDRNQMNNIRNDAYNHILGPNAEWIVNSIMELVDVANNEQKAYMFDYISNLFRNNQLNG